MTEDIAREILKDHQLIDPAHVDNPYGRWLVDGCTAHYWAGVGFHDQHAVDIMRVLLALDRRELADPYRE